jgi:hypothetical protein
MAEKHPKRPHDLNQWAKTMVDIATGEVAEDSRIGRAPDTPASQFAWLGGLKDGRARAEKLSADERSDIARRAAAVRWHKDDSGSSDH